jgi:hypothetical protein
MVVRRPAMMGGGVVNRVVPVGGRVMRAGCAVGEGGLRQKGGAGQEQGHGGCGDELHRKLP